jgi:hypothetical protein
MQREAMRPTAGPAHGRGYRRSLMHWKVDQHRARDVSRFAISVWEADTKRTHEQALNPFSQVTALPHGSPRAFSAPIRALVTGTQRAR